jgi:hypothetical protein
MCASKAVVMVRGLLRFCNEHLATPGQLLTIEKMASIMMSSITNWFGNMELNPLLAEAMLLDPRFKTSGFTDNSAAELAIRSVTEAASRETVMMSSPEPVKSPPRKPVTAVDISHTKSPAAKSTQQSSSVWDDYDQQVSDMLVSSTNYVTLSVTGTNDCIQSSSDQQKSSVWSDYDQKISGIVSTTKSPNSDAAKQVERFLQEPPVPRQDSCLEWWRNRTAIYPRLLPIVRERLCIVATSISSENIFTSTGLALNDRRRSLSPCEVRQRVFLNANMHP